MLKKIKKQKWVEKKAQDILKKKEWWKAKNPEKLLK